MADRTASTFTAGVDGGVGLGVALGVADAAAAAGGGLAGDSAVGFWADDDVAVSAPVVEGISETTWLVETVSAGASEHETTTTQQVAITNAATDRLPDRAGGRSSGYARTLSGTSDRPRPQGGFYRRGLNDRLDLEAAARLAGSPV